MSSTYSLAVTTQLFYKARLFTLLLLLSAFTGWRGYFIVPIATHLIQRCIQRWFPDLAPVIGTGVWVQLPAADRF